MLEVNLAQRKLAVFLDTKPVGGPVTITVQPSVGRLSLRAKQRALGNQPEIAGFPIDGSMNTRKESGGVASLRLGPDEWMLLCDDGDTDDAFKRLSDELGDAPHSLVDVSHRDVTFEVTGAHAATVINSGCPVDLALDAFPVGSASRTVFGKCEIVLARITETTWRVTCWRSFGPYVHGYLAEAAQDYAGA